MRNCFTSTLIYSWGIFILLIFIFVILFSRFVFMFLLVISFMDGLIYSKQGVFTLCFFIF